MCFHLPWIVGGGKTSLTLSGQGNSRMVRRKLIDYFIRELLFIYINETDQFIFSMTVHVPVYPTVED